jgi:hypothetical protein
MNLACLKQTFILVDYHRRRTSSSHRISILIPELSWVPFSLTITSSLTQKSWSPWPFLNTPDITTLVEVPTFKITLRAFLTLLLSNHPCWQHPNPLYLLITDFHHTTSLFIVTTTMNQSSTNFHQLVIRQILILLISTYNTRTVMTSIQVVLLNPYYTRTTMIFQLGVRQFFPPILHWHKPHHHVLFSYSFSATLSNEISLNGY